MSDLPEDASDVLVHCGLCRRQFTGAGIWEHLRVAHDVDEDLGHWPDGKPVVIDMTLEAS